MFYKYNNHIISIEEMNEIEEMEAAWAADLEKKAEVVKNSLVNNFAFAFGPMFQVTKIEEVAAEKRNQVLAEIEKKLEQACAINSYSNDFDELEANNNLPVDYRQITELDYDTVSYVMAESDNDDCLVLAFNLKV